MWVCCTYQEILLVSRLELHGFSVLGTTSKAATASAAWEAGFCHWEVFDDDTWSHGYINNHCPGEIFKYIQLTTDLFF